MTPEEKQKAKDKLRADIALLKIQTFDWWLLCLELDEEGRKQSGFSKGSEDMNKRLVAGYRKKMTVMMKPFDRGDFD